MQVRQFGIFPQSLLSDLQSFWIITAPDPVAADGGGGFSKAEFAGLKLLFVNLNRSLADVAAESEVPNVVLERRLHVVEISKTLGKGLLLFLPLLNPGIKLSDLLAVLHAGSKREIVHQGPAFSVENIDSIVVPAERYIRILADQFFQRDDNH